jgi:hypothetical protein
MEGFFCLPLKTPEPDGTIIKAVVHPQDANELEAILNHLANAFDPDQGNGDYSVIRRRSSIPRTGAPHSSKMQATVELQLRYRRNAPLDFIRDAVCAWLKHRPCLRPSFTYDGAMAGIAWDQLDSWNQMSPAASHTISSYIAGMVEEENYDEHQSETGLTEEEVFELARPFQERKLAREALEIKNSDSDRVNVFQETPMRLECRNEMVQCKDHDRPSEQDLLRQDHLDNLQDDLYDDEV